MTQNTSMVSVGSQWVVDNIKLKNIAYPFTGEKRRYHGGEEDGACDQSSPPSASEQSRQSCGCQTTRSNGHNQFPAACRPLQRPERSRGRLQSKRNPSEYPVLVRT